MIVAYVITDLPHNHEAAFNPARNIEANDRGFHHRLCVTGCIFAKWISGAKATKADAGISRSL